MSFFDDFIYRVKTGRLFAGLEKPEDPESKPKQEVLEEINRQIMVLETKMEAFDKISKGITVLETKVEALDEVNKGIGVLETKMEAFDEMNREIMVLETRIDALKEMNKEFIIEEDETLSESQEEIAEVALSEELPPESQKEINEITSTEEPLSKIPEETKKEPVDLESQPEKSKERATVIKPSVKKQIGPDVVIHFVCMDKTYIVENFNLNFRQDVNQLRNRPDSFTYGGTMQIALSGFLDSDLDDWITQTYLMRNGEIRFFPNMPKITDSSLLTIFFEDAYCTACKKTMDTATFGVSTTLTVSPRRIRLGNEEFDNRWKEKESLPFNIKSV